MLRANCSNLNVRRSRVTPGRQVRLQVMCDPQLGQWQTGQVDNTDDSSSEKKPSRHYELRDIF
jgi:hypothetical protein